MPGSDPKDNIYKMLRLKIFVTVYNFLLQTIAILFSSSTCFFFRSLFIVVLMVYVYMSLLNAPWAEMSLAVSMFVDSVESITYLSHMITLSCSRCGGLRPHPCRILPADMHCQNLYLNVSVIASMLLGMYYHTVV